MWKSISQVLADHLGAYYFIKQKQKVHTGEMHEAWIINDGIQPVFVKVNEKSYRSMFRAEADQLNLLAKTQSIHVPQVYGVGCSQNHSFLLLEALPLNEPSAQSMATFGTQLAQLHQWGDVEHYGLDFDTWLGSVHQPNAWSENWARFFSEQRIGWQLQLCKEKGLEFANIDELVSLVASRLAKHQPKPSLLQGNLWIENCAMANNQPFTYDPACYWGDRECDLAFSELFQPFPEQFYQNYHRTFPLNEGYPQRKKLYQLYYLLNFSHRFSSHYVELCRVRITQLMREDN